MSYYASKHPGLYLYLALVAITVLSFLFLEVGPTEIGLLAMLWGGYTALRTLSLYEISSCFCNYTRQSTMISKEHNAQSSALAHDLVRRMTNSANIKQGVHALYCLHERTLLWFALALGYTAYHLHINSTVMGRTDLMDMVCIMFMIGATFWGGQSYAYNNKDAKLMSVVFAIALCLSLSILPIKISLPQLSQTFSSLSILESTTPYTFLVLLASYSIATLLYALIHRNKATFSALSGIMIVALLCLCHVFIEPSQASPALWISGWGLFSLTWSRAYRPILKRYVLYQSD